MEEPSTSRPPRGRRRGPRRTNRYNRKNRSDVPSRKKKNPILAFFSKLFGGARKANGTSVRNGEQSHRSDRIRNASTSASEGSEPRQCSATAAALAVENPEVTNEKLYIGNLSYDASESDLFDHFSKIGGVNNVEIVRDKSGRSKGFGFVVMNTLEAAKEASAKYHRTEFMGRQIVVAGSKK